jgi:hypothetical protein
MALGHLPYSLAMSPPDFFQFPQLKSVLKGQFTSAGEVSAKVTSAIREVSKMVYKCWQNCVTAKLNYLKEMLCK